MQDNSLIESVRRIMADVFALDISSIPDNAEINELPNWDSGNHVVLVMALEEEFNLSFEVSEIEAMGSLPDILAIIEQKG
jgi:acyl carrier protein